MLPTSVGCSSTICLGSSAMQVFEKRKQLNATHTHSFFLQKKADWIFHGGKSRLATTRQSLFFFFCHYTIQVSQFFALAATVLSSCGTAVNDATPKGPSHFLFLQATAASTWETQPLSTQRMLIGCCYDWLMMQKKHSQSECVKLQTCQK